MARKAGEVRRQEGVLRVLARAWAWVRGLVYRDVIVFGNDLTAPKPDPDTDLPIEIRLLTTDDVEAYARFRHEPSGGSRRLARGDLCVAAWLDGEIVSAGWIRRGIGFVPEIGRSIRLSDEEVYVFGSYTAEHVRGRGIASARGLWTSSYLAAVGYRCAVSCISPQNRPAFGPPRRMGYIRLGTAGYFRLGPWRRDFVRPDGGPRRWVSRKEPIVVARDFPKVAAVGKPAPRVRPQGLSSDAR